MPREKALAVESPATQHLRLVVRPLRVADVAIFYGERSGGIRTYLDAKTRYAAESRGFEHHLIIPGRSNATVARPGGWTHTVRSLNVNRANGYRLPLDGNVVTEVLRTVSPDVVLLHDPFWHPRRLCRLVKDSDGVAVMVHHSSAALGAHAWPGPAGVYARGIRVWLRHAYKRADIVTSRQFGRSVAARSHSPLETPPGCFARSRPHEPRHRIPPPLRSSPHATRGRPH